jgi:transaldolase/glucose-6-phosphate isomerase
LRSGLEDDVEGARHVIETLGRAGISLEAVTDRLLEDGIALFNKAFDALLAAVAGASDVASLT